MPDRSSSVAMGSSVDMSTSVVLYDASIPMLRRRMRNKTKVPNVIPTGADGKHAEQHESMLPLADASYSSGAGQLGTERDIFKKNSNRSLQTVP